jgi:hypothetical protein
MRIEFTKLFMMGFGKRGGTVFFDPSPCDLSFVIKARSYPKKKPLILGQAISIQQEHIHSLCDEGKFKEAGWFTCNIDILDWISEQGFHVEITENDYEVVV